mgnify:CR=1 FL=1
MNSDVRKKISEAFLSHAPGCDDCVDQCVLDRHFHRSLIASKRVKEHALTEDDRKFIREALANYVEILLERNFWSLAHLSKKQPLHDIDPVLANEVYRICLNVDELKAILYFDSDKDE